MPVQTTVIGSFPKPAYLEIPDWFKTGTSTNSSNATRGYTEILAKQTDEEKEKLEVDILRATKEVILAQHKCGINVLTDGEVRRENYIHYLCRFIEGIDFENLTETSCRDGAYITHLPTVRSKVAWRGPLDVVGEWRKAQDLSPVPVKYTLPGPMTIIGTLHDAHYHNEEKLAEDLARVVNMHVRALSAAGCKHIQIDEPVFARFPQKALDWGIPCLDRCFEGADQQVLKVVHMCCGYPDHLDQEGYKKADPESYFKLADALDNSVVDAVSLEDAHRHNDLKLLEHFRKTKVVLGVVQVAQSRVETAQEIEARLNQALEHIDEDRLIAAPDCGLALLPVPVLEEKLANMCSAANQLIDAPGLCRRLFQISVLGARAGFTSSHGYRLTATVGVDA
eukprot:CAMPEP_0115278880 /NCGR_PEP_ID=MMETSP0270-20121206/57978_1 /TAXON_ID=71861 /ORGANISM="Scrippsiella trochoidea, Strain CCMP3099" /LENGTH=393 /DNA_ID=CAMNT_0002695555 /DNA_START=85 /DNA_END=1263 /DNA_ORIENTATION=-